MNMKLVNLRSQRDMDNIYKESDEINQMDINDNKEYDEIILVKLLI